MAVRTETMDLAKKNKLILALYSASVVLLPSVTFSADVEVGVRLGASQTDNVFLNTSPNEIDDIVYQVSPFLNVVHESPNFDANVEYTFDWFRYSDLKVTSEYHRGQASLTGRAWQQSLEAEIGVQRTQALADPDGVIPPGRLARSGNLIDKDRWWFNPRLIRNLGSVVNLDANYQYSRIRFDDPLAQDNTSQFGTLIIQNYEAGQGLTWAARYNWRRTEYEISPPWEFQQAKGELGFWVSERTRIFGAGGKESSWDNPFDSSMTGSFWEAGFAHSAGENLSFEFAGGERSFGSSWRGELAYTFRRGSSSLSYDESPATVGFNQGRGTQGVLFPGDLDDFLDRPGAAERYISSRFQWDLILEFRRAGVSLVVFDEDRSERFSENGNPRDAQFQSGVSVKISWQAGVRTEFVASGSMIKQETAAGSESDFRGAGLSVNYRLGSRSNLSLGYSYNEQQPRGQTPLGRDYVVNVVSLFFTITI